MSKRSSAVRGVPVEQPPRDDAAIDHPCRHCSELKAGVNPSHAPHEFLFHEGRSATSPTASRYTCLICNTQLTLERMGPSAGWV